MNAQVTRTARPRLTLEDKIERELRKESNALDTLSYVCAAWRKLPLESILIVANHEIDRMKHHENLNDPHKAMMLRRLESMMRLLRKV